MAIQFVPIALKGLASAKTVVAGSQAAGNAASGLGASTLRQAFANKELASSAGKSFMSPEMTPGKKDNKQNNDDDLFWSKMDELSVGKLARQVMNNPSLMKFATSAMTQMKGLGSSETLKNMTSLMPGNLHESVMQSAKSAISSMARFGQGIGTQGSDMEAMNSSDSNAGIMQEMFDRFDEGAKGTKSKVDNTLEQNAFDPAPQAGAIPGSSPGKKT